MRDIGWREFEREREREKTFGERKMVEVTLGEERERERKREKERDNTFGERKMVKETLGEERERERERERRHLVKETWWERDIGWREFEREREDIWWKKDDER